MSKPVIKETEFSDFIKASWMIFYEGTGCLERVPAELKKDSFIVFTLKFIRHSFFHDFGQGDGEQQKIERLSERYQFLIGKDNLHSFEPEDFEKVQVRILRDLVTFLENLKRYLNKT
jgi:hypothetical protein